MKLILTKTEAEQSIANVLEMEVEIQMDTPSTNVARPIEPNETQKNWLTIRGEFFNMACTLRSVFSANRNMKIEFIKMIRGYFASHGLRFGLQATKNLLESDDSVDIRDMGWGAKNVKELSEIYEKLG